MKGLKIILGALCVLLCAQSTLQAQASDSLITVSDPCAVRLAYHNSLIYPGFRLGVDVPRKFINLRKTKKNGKVMSLSKTRYLTGQLSWYYHPRFHTNWYVTAGGLLRRTRSSGFFIQSALEAGYSRTFLAATTYVVKDNGAVERARLAGNNYFALVMSGGVGYDLKKKGSPLKLYLNGQALFLMPYNSAIYPRAILELGVVYTPANFLRIHHRLKTLNKTR